MNKKAILKNKKPESTWKAVGAGQGPTGKLESNEQIQVADLSKMDTTGMVLVEPNANRVTRQAPAANRMGNAASYQRILEQ